MFRGLFRYTCYALFLCLLVVLLLEGMLWLTATYFSDNPRLERLISLTRDQRLHEETFWEELFLQTYKPGNGLDGLNDPDDLLGWQPRKSISVELAGHRYTTNARGYRSTSEYVHQATQYEVCAVGDSFTFGMDAGDKENWPAVLQSVAPELEVVNLGVPGYGVGQMYLRLKRELAHLHPELVIAAYIQDDLYRTDLTFRGYKKPRFVLEGGKLELTNMPIGSPDAVRAELESSKFAGSDFLGSLRTVNLATYLLKKIRGYTSLNSLVRLNTELFLAMRHLCEEQGMDFMVVYLASGREIRYPEMSSFGEMFLKGLADEHGIQTLDTRRSFQAHPETEFSLRHYGARGAAVVADAVYDAIKKQPSYLEFQKNQ